MKTFSSIDPDFVHEVLKSLNADHVCNSYVSIKSAYNFYIKCKHRLLQANFPLHKSESNSPEL